MISLSMGIFNFLLIANFIATRGIDNNTYTSIIIFVQRNKKCVFRNKMKKSPIA